MALFWPFSTVTVSPPTVISMVPSVMPAFVNSVSIHVASHTIVLTPCVIAALDELDPSIVNPLTGNDTGAGSGAGKSIGISLLVVGSNATSGVDDEVSLAKP